MYLVKRRQIWWALHELPKRLHATHGRRLARSLGTPDKAKARHLASILWLHDWSKRVKGQEPDRADQAEVALYRDLIQNAETEREKELLKDHVAEMAEDRYRKAKTAKERENALRFNEEAQGRLTPLTEHLDDWLSAAQDTLKSKDMKRAAITKMSLALPYIQEVDQKAAQAWLANVVKTEGLTAKTATRLLSFVRGYWKHLKSEGIVTEEPFVGLTMPPTARRSGSWLPFTPAQVVALEKRARAKDGELADLIVLGMWTGARIEELCSLKIEQVDFEAQAFTVVDAKTSAGNREVPIHSRLLPKLKELAGERTEGYVLADLTPNKFGDRSNAVGKRFGRLKKAAGFGAQHVFHGIRKCVSTQLENALVPEGISADLLGHEKPTITYGLYSGGASLEVKRTALEKLHY